MSWNYEGWLDMLRRTSPPEPKPYILKLYDAEGVLVSQRSFSWAFDGIGKDSPGQKSSHEEYGAAMRAREMYRDAAYAAGKWPTLPAHRPGGIIEVKDPSNLTHEEFTKIYGGE